MDKKREQWKDINGYEGLYQVSSEGRVKSLKRIVVTRDKVKRTLCEKVLKLGLCGGGYLIAGLSKNNKRRTLRVHRLVMESFRPTEDSSLQVNHIDGNKLNNMVENLEWCTASENIKHSYKNGMSSCFYGEKSNLSKLTNKDVNRIRMAGRCGMQTKEIAKIFNTVPANINHILSGKNWGRLPFNVVCESFSVEKQIKF
jgi:hypothetical protein